jgi:hypothetical protein
LLDGSLLLLAFGLLGPVEALMELSAFVLSMAALGWRPGTAFPGGSSFLAASGAAFSAVVVAPMATALACRSATQWPGTLGWCTNRLLVYAIGAELTLLMCFLYVRPLANILGHTALTLTGAIVAAVAFPAILAADALQKRSATKGIKRHK